jgi:hypothetical protein
VSFIGAEGMTPAQLASDLRRIAAKIDSSKQPSRSLVAAELNRALLRVGASWEDIDKAKQTVDSVYIPLLKQKGTRALSRDWETIAGLIENPTAIERSKWQGWTPEALSALERTLGDMIDRPELYLSEQV